MTYVISYLDYANRTRFVRWYKDGSKWVERKHAKTATHYASIDDARSHVPIGLKLAPAIVIVTIP